MSLTKKVVSVRSIIAGLSAGIVACGAIGIASAAPPDSTRVIVVFKPGSASSVRNAVANARGEVKHEIFGENAFSVEVPLNALNGLERNPNVSSVEPDELRFPFAGTTPSTGNPYQLGQLVPYGI